MSQAASDKAATVMSDPSAAMRATKSPAGQASRFEGAGSSVIKAHSAAFDQDQYSYTRIYSYGIKLLTRGRRLSINVPRSAHSVPSNRKNNV